MRNDLPCRQSLYAEVTRRIIAELEQGRVLWAQAWDPSACGCAIPANAVTGHRYSGINVLILWAAGIAGHRGTQRWLTYRQAAAIGGHVRCGEKGITICYADRFAPWGEVATAGETEQEQHEAKKLAFSRRFAVFNIDQCVGLPAALTRAPERVSHVDMLPAMATLIKESGAEFRIAGDHAF